MKNQRAIAVFYLILAGVGLVTAWYFNTAAILSQENLLTAWFTTNADLVLAFDLFIVAFAVAQAEEAIAQWILGDAPFTAKLHPEFAHYGDYDQLMRLQEWNGRQSISEEQA